MYISYIFQVFLSQFFIKKINLSYHKKSVKCDNMSNSSDFNKNINRIIIPVDGSKYSLEAANTGIHLGKTLDRPVTVMHVIHIPVHTFPEYSDTYSKMIDYLKEEAQSIIDDVKEIADKQNVKIDTDIVEGVPDDEIIKTANENDLIIMGSKGRTALERVFLGSVSEKVLHHSENPVMIIR